MSLSYQQLPLNDLSDAWVTNSSTTAELDFPGGVHTVFLASPVYWGGGGLGLTFPDDCKTAALGSSTRRKSATPVQPYSLALFYYSRNLSHFSINYKSSQGASHAGRHPLLGHRNSGSEPLTRGSGEVWHIGF